MTQKMLIVEDEESILELIFQVFKASGDYQILRARDGEEGLRIALTDNPEIIILDVNLPKITGYEVCRSIRSDPKISHTKILMTSGMAQSSDRHKAIEMGADDYLTKPFNLAVLAEKVKTLLTSTSEER